MALPTTTLRATSPGIHNWIQKIMFTTEHQPSELEDNDGISQWVAQSY